MSVLSLCSTFDRIVDGSKTVFVRFDKEYSYGDEHDAWKELAGKVGDSSADMLSCDVGVSEYGDKDNSDIAERFSIKSDDFPQYRLFTKGTSSSGTPITYTGDKKYDAFLRFLQEKAGVWIGLPGQVKTLDGLAKEFVSGDKKAVLKKAEKAAGALEAKDADSGKYYVKVMGKVSEKADFVAKETERLQKMIDDGSVRMTTHAPACALQRLRTRTQPAEVGGRNGCPLAIYPALTSRHVSPWLVGRSRRQRRSSSAGGSTSSRRSPRADGDGLSGTHPEHTTPPAPSAVRLVAFRVAACRSSAAMRACRRGRALGRRGASIAHSRERERRGGGGWAISTLFALGRCTRVGGERVQDADMHRCTRCIDAQMHRCTDADRHTDGMISSDMKLKTDAR